MPPGTWSSYRMSWSCMSLNEIEFFYRDGDRTMGYRGGFPNPVKREKARILLDAGNPVAALPLIAGSCFGAGYDVDYFELLGRTLLGCGQVENAGRFLFLSGIRRPEYAAPIALFLARHSDSHN